MYDFKGDKQYLQLDLEENWQPMQVLPERWHMSNSELHKTTQETKFWSNWTFQILFKGKPIAEVKTGSDLGMGDYE